MPLSPGLLPRFSLFPIPSPLPARSSSPPHLVFALSPELSFIPFAPYTHQFPLALSPSLTVAFRSHRCALSSHLRLPSYRSHPSPRLPFSPLASPLCRGHILLSLSLIVFPPSFSHETRARRHIQSLSFPRVPFLSISDTSHFVRGLLSLVVLSPLPAIHAASSFRSSPISYPDPFSLSFLFFSPLSFCFSRIYPRTHPSYTNRVTSYIPGLHPIHRL